MGFADHYFSKQKGFSPYFTDVPSDKLCFAVIIPAYCETGLTDTLQALWNCTRPEGNVEVIIVVNSPENSSSSVIAANQLTLHSASQWINCRQDPAFRFLLMDKTQLPAHDAGVGLARKTGMDEALFRLNRIGNQNAYILSFDADSVCDANYFTSIEEATCRQTAVKGFCVYFEHPLAGQDFPEKVYRGIIQYELHLRYVIQFLRYTGFPHAYHTVGSCFGVRADVYAAQGGMNKRKAGEDFYFLHKIIPLGDFIDITGTRVIPSPRASERAPFGTGAAIGKFLASDEEVLYTYAPGCFIALRSFLQQSGKLYKAEHGYCSDLLQQQQEPLRNYLFDNHALEALNEINTNCSSVAAFNNRFFRWFDAFRVVKFLNYASREYYRQIPVSEAAVEFLKITGRGKMHRPVNPLDLLMLFRELERKGER